MINIDEINKEIETLENGCTSYSNCQKLAILYTVKDHLMNKMTMNSNSMDMSMNSPMSPIIENSAVLDK